MDTKEALLQFVTQLSPIRQYELLDFARYLCWLEQREQEEQEDWHRLGLSQLGKAYGPEEPEYTTADIKREARP